MQPDADIVRVRLIYVRDPLTEVYQVGDPMTVNISWYLAGR